MNWPNETGQSSSGQNIWNKTGFVQKWSTNLDQLATLPKEIIITGDLNFHFNNPHDANVCWFTEQFDALELVQHVNEATRMRGHLLGLIITHDVSSIIQNSPVNINSCLYNAKGSQCGEHRGIMVTVN